MAPEKGRVIAAKAAKAAKAVGVVVKKERRLTNAQIEAALLAEFTRIFISLYRKEKRYIKIKLSKIISMLSDFTILIGKDGVQLQKCRMFHHCDFHGTKTGGRAKAFDKIEAIMVRAYGDFCIQLDLVNLDMCYVLHVYISYNCYLFILRNIMVFIEQPFSIVEC